MHWFFSFIVYFVLTRLIIDANALSSSHLVNQTVHRFVRQAGCKNQETRCESGECISSENFCDGKVDCTDGSDETSSCANIKCPSFAYVCSYGACVDGDARCNGADDCYDKSDEENCNNPPMVVPTTKCSNNQFQCNNGECIDRVLLCDGEANCQDGTDEVSQSCRQITCPSFSHRCEYGACVDGDARCNGQKDCADGSDELRCGPKKPSTTTSRTTTKGRTTTTLRPGGTVTTKKTTARPTVTTGAPVSAGCILPPQPKNGRYNISGNVPGLGPGKKIGLFSSIEFSCRKDHSINPNASNVYFCTADNTWFPTNSFPECIATCRPLISQTVDIKCKRGEVTQDCTQVVFPGTVATLKCKPLYEYPGGIPPFRSIKCSDGSWDYSLNEYRCQPACGRKVSKGAQTLIVGGAPAIPGDYPWQIGVYRSNEDNDHICGGSILNQKIVISAAHCFTNLNNGNLYPKENYLIAAGKHYRPFNDLRDTEGKQFSPIKEIHIPEKYKGLIRNYDNDIAIVIIEKPFVLSVTVQPVCLDWDEVVKETDLHLKYGVVTGWGFTKEGDDPSEELKQLDVPYVDFSTCYDNVPPDFRTYLTDDKMCAGFLNGSSVCQGDSGGPLVFKEGEKYYIRGIVSVGPLKGSSCDSRQYGAYTKISKYLDFISQIETDNRVIP